MIKKKTGWDEAKKQKVQSAMDIILMSSEEEGSSEDESFFKVKPLPWRSDELNCLIEDLDSKYFRSQSSRSKRQMIKRVKGDIPSTRPKPTVKPGQEWVLAQTEF
jgi:hypothetical protein